MSMIQTGLTARPAMPAMVVSTPPKFVTYNEKRIHLAPQFNRLPAEVREPRMATRGARACRSGFAVWVAFPACAWLDVPLRRPEAGV